jgi:hypothetical protein
MSKGKNSKIESGYVQKINADFTNKKVIGVYIWIAVVS